MNTQIQNGTKTVSIYNQSGKFSCRLYVNCQGSMLGDATLLAKKFKTLAGATAWARKVVA